MFKVSFVVDKNPVLYYQAELLLFSLEHFAKQNKETILVQCTDEVDEKFLSFLRTNNYPFKIIEPYLDGKYCNKIKQLEAFYFDEKCDGVFLLDTDVFVLEPLIPYNSATFCAKVVDADNPPLKVLENIFDAAGLPHDQKAACDWAGTTFASNFNGGFYYVPQKDLIAISEGWKKWATWLFARPALFETKEQAIHTDQVAMSMAICETGVGYKNLPSNFNCPVHSPDAQKYFNPDMPISLLHYHREINIFGLLNKEFSGNQQIEKAIEKANEALASQAQFIFFEGFRKSLIKPVVFSEKSNILHSKLSALNRKFNKKIRLILHGGTSKTGTTSLQFFFDRNHDELLKSGYFYPRVYMMNTFAPKHQWIMRSLIASDAELLFENFQAIFFQLPENIHTIVLSTEGIHNHWTDFSQESKSFLSILSEVFDVHFWVWFRKPASFMNSLYRQNLKNPKNEVSCYGQDLSLSEMLRDKWFLSHLDYLGFIYEMEAIFKKNVSVFKFEGDIISVAKKRLNLRDGVNLNERENVGLSDAGIEMLRIINRFPLNAKEKEHCVSLLSKIDGILNNHPQMKSENSEAVSFINQTMAIQKHVLESDYNISL